tara:strand:- start:296 stop:514 length:219 start_codon:yes stop_codon:yes gene_type:complete
MWRYTHNDIVYDVEKTSAEGQATFMLLAEVQSRIEKMETEVTINQAASVALHQKMQEFLSDDAIVEDDETED